MNLDANRLERLRADFCRRWSTIPTHCARAPGRVNLIGEHTDYNDGFVLPMAIDRDIWIVFASRNDRQVRLWSADFGQASAFAVDAIARDPSAPWSNYVRGVAWALAERGIALRGLDAVIQGQVPIGAGLSSSAALEVAAGLALLNAAGQSIPPTELALACQRAEGEFVGNRCGIMDQFVSALGRAGHALFLDCRTLDYEHVPLPAGYRIVVANSMVRRALVDSAYNERRAQCEEAARAMGLRALRDADESALESARARMSEGVYRRARHVIAENRRVLQAVDTMWRGDAGTFGALMDASHASLRDDYEVSCRELDTLVDIARRLPGCLGARMTGAGFGGCTVNLVRADAADAFVAALREAYRAATGLDPDIYICDAADGAGVSEL
ncbi:MAG: galactokinase [Anaerolineae bacterium]|nr:galactokinase [Anaerolineae bacterium]